jgi:hypothetical protein
MLTLSFNCIVMRPSPFQSESFTNLTPHGCLSSVRVNSGCIRRLSENSEHRLNAATRGKG